MVRERDRARQMASTGLGFNDLKLARTRIETFKFLLLILNFNRNYSCFLYLSGCTISLDICSVFRVFLDRIGSIRNVPEIYFLITVNYFEITGDCCNSIRSQPH